MQSKVMSDVVVEKPAVPRRSVTWAWGASIAIGLMALLAAWAWTPDQDRTALEARYAGPPSRFVDVAGMRMHVRDSGPRDAQVLLLLHGFGASLHTWDDWAAALEGSYRVIRVDLPGSALTGADPGGDYSDARGVQVLLALLDHLGVAHASLVGHSMGGRLAWRLAADAPQRVDRLVLLAPDGFASPGFEYGKPMEVGPLVQVMRWVLPRPLVRMSLAPAYADPAKLTDASLTRYHAMLLAPTVRSAMLDRMRQWVLQDPTPFLARVRAPVLLVWGAQDRMIPLANAQDYLRVLPGARLVTLPGVGHLPQEEAPAAALPAVREFLR
jgi:pimeloyl-ACP methyl ester carboxylesterase